MAEMPWEGAEEPRTVRDEDLLDSSPPQLEEPRAEEPYDPLILELRAGMCGKGSP